MVYKATQKFPADERFGLVTQMRRAVVSIAANIAERRKGQPPAAEPSIPETLDPPTP